MIPCPSAGGAGFRVRLTSRDRIVFLCEECDALWLHASGIDMNTYILFADSMATRGRPGLWSEVKVFETDVSPP